MKRLIALILPVLLFAASYFTTASFAVSYEIPGKDQFTDTFLTFDVWTGEDSVQVVVDPKFIPESLRDSVSLAPDAFRMLGDQDDNILDMESYNVFERDGVTVIELKEKYIKQLADGSHLFYAVFEFVTVPLRLFVVTQPVTISGNAFVFERSDDGAYHTTLQLGATATLYPQLFEGLYLDGKALSADDYSVSGMGATTLLILQKTYTDTLDPGKYSFDVNFLNCKGIRAELQILAKGDLNGDEKVNSIDARIALRAAAQIEQIDIGQKYAADIDGNGKVNSIDARQILRISAHLSD